MDFPSTFPSHPDYQIKRSDDEPASAAAATPPPVPAKEPPPLPPKPGLPEVNQSGSVPGHHPLGRTLVIHSVCVLPPYQRLGLGKTLLKSYLQRMETAGVADRAALLALPEMVGWYEGGFGFQDEGDSVAKFGGGGWRDLVSAAEVFAPSDFFVDTDAFSRRTSFRIRVCGRSKPLVSKVIIVWKEQIKYTRASNIVVVVVVAPLLKPQKFPSSTFVPLNYCAMLVPYLSVAVRVHAPSLPAFKSHLCPHPVPFPSLFSASHSKAQYVYAFSNPLRIPNG